MPDLTISKPTAEIHEVTDLEKPNEGNIRIWSNLFPNDFIFQIRSRNPLKGWLSGNGAKERDFIASVHITAGELSNIVRNMLKYAYGVKSVFSHSPNDPETIRVKFTDEDKGWEATGEVVDFFVNKDGADSVIVKLDKGTWADNGLYISHIYALAGNVEKI